ncbi:protein GLUTAMINE DUMPER 1-like [Bidens hawaiensis]|uniref:protein GLUTAMINE DUMPER 1-like n=1 Tax=Bidens hawaiensis TaxID=980011 RepID=UPI00404ACEE8
MGSSEASLWRFDSPLIYLFGGISVVLALIAIALIILACSQRKRRLTGGDIESGDDTHKASKAAYNGCNGVDDGPKIVVIMAGDEVPTYLATPSDVVAEGKDVSK